MAASNYPNWLAGQRITAAMLNSMLPIDVVKPADETISSKTLQNDNDLVAAVEANATYQFSCEINYEGGTQGSSDLQWQWAVPASATMRYEVVFVGTGGGVTVTAQSGADVVTAGTNGSGSRRAILMKGSVITSSTAGNVQFTWAQNTGTVVSTTVHAQSTLSLKRTA